MKSSHVDEELPPGWRDFLDQVASRHPVAKRADEWLCLSWPEQPDLTIQVTCVPARGLMRVMLTADLCRADQVAERDALELAARLLVGGVIVQRGVLALRCVLTEGCFTARDLDQTIHALRETAFPFRARLLDRKANAIASLYYE